MPDEQYIQTMLERYETTHRELQVYPHYKAWLDAEVAIYETTFGEGQAFMHGFIECFYMLQEFRTIHDDEVRQALAMTMSNKGSDLKKAITKLKSLYQSGTFQK